MTERSPMSDRRVWLEAVGLLLVMTGAVLLAANVASTSFFADLHGPVGEIAALPFIVGSVIGSVWLAQRTIRDRTVLRSGTVLVGMVPVLAIVVGVALLLTK